MEQEQSLPQIKKKKGFIRRLIKWCFVCFILFTLVIALLAALFFRVPQKLGILPSKAERHLIMTPDRAASEELLAAARSKGLSTQGVSLYVFSQKDGEGSVAVVGLDARDGFTFSGGGRLGPVGSAFASIAGSAKAEELGINRITMTYTSESGRQLMALSAPRSDILAFERGAVSEESFMQSVDGDLNLPAIVNEQIESIQNMFQ